MSALDSLRESFGEPSRDTKLNLELVLRGESSLTQDQRWLTALAAAFNAKNPAVLAAVLAEAGQHVGAQVLEDAQAAATLMAMNNVFYRFRHLVGKDAYSSLPARLRMNRLLKPATSRHDFELACLAVSAVNGCEACVRSHEQVVLEGGLTEQHVHDAVRIAAVISAAAVATFASEQLTRGEQAA